MSKVRNLPRLGTPEWMAFFSRWETSTTPEELEQLAIDYGYKATAKNPAYHSLRSSMKHRGYSRRDIVTKSKKPVTEPKIKPTLSLNLHNWSVIEPRDIECMELVESDHHVDKITPTYNGTIYAKRLDRLTEATMHILNLHRPIRKLYIEQLGDMVQGENPKQGSKIGEVEKAVFGQIYDTYIPNQVRHIRSLKQGVEEIEIRCVCGNHGIYDRKAPRKTNWDRFAYKALQRELANDKGIKIFISDFFYDLFEINGFRYFLIHGNQVKAQQGVPLIALRRKLNEYFSYVGGFNYARCGHWHTWGSDTVNSVATFDICPTIVTDDEWGLEVVGRAYPPVQLIRGNHPKYGVSFQYHIQTDNDFLPCTNLIKGGNNTGSGTIPS